MGFAVAGLPTEGDFGNLAHIPSWLDDDHWLALGEPAWNDASWDQGGRLAWRDWRRRLILYREFVAADAQDNAAAQWAEMHLCAADPAYFLAMYGWIFEPRDHVDPDFPDKGWRPWALLPHQAWILDELKAAIRHPSPLGDIVVEKSRDMGATWTFCGWAAHRWLFDRDFTAGLMSYREAEVVEDHPDSMLFKVKCILGIEEEAPGLPEWIFGEVLPGGDFYIRKKELDHRATLRHPSRANFLRGETMTKLAGTGNRTFARIHDEAAKWKIGLREIMTNTASVTSHRFVLSSAYSDFNDDFKKYVDYARDARITGVLAPTLMRLDAKLHPLHDDNWLIRAKSSYEAAGDLEGFEREVMINYRPASKYIYTELVDRCPVLPDMVYDPNLTTFVSIDPGLADLCSFVVCQVVPRPDDSDPLWKEGRAYDINWLDAIALSGHGVDFWSHVATGILPEPSDSAFHDFFDERGFDKRHARLRDFMDFMSTLPWDRGRVQWCGDPAGHSREQTSKTTWYKEMAKHTQRLTTRRVAQLAAEGVSPLPQARMIYPRVEDMYRYRSYHERQQHMRPVLRRSRFARTPGAFMIREALGNARRLDPTPRQLGDPGMEHNDDFNTVSACEFFAVYLRHGMGAARTPKKEAERDRDWLASLPPGPNGSSKRWVR